MAKDFHPFRDMAESAKAQHQVDKANLEAAKAEAKANFEEGKLPPKARQALMQEQREEQIAAANARRAEAEARTEHLKDLHDAAKKD